MSPLGTLFYPPGWRVARYQWPPLWQFHLCIIWSANNFKRRHETVLYVVQWIVGCNLPWWQTVMIEGLKSAHKPPIHAWPSTTPTSSFGGESIDPHTHPAEIGRFGPLLSNVYGGLWKAARSNQLIEVSASICARYPFNLYLKSSSTLYADYIDI